MKETMQVKKKTEKRLKAKDESVKVKKKKSPTGRPTKLTRKFIAIARKIVEQDLNAIIHTDMDLLFLINEELPEKERIVDSTFELWKKGGIESDLLKSFSVVMKKALIRQRFKLFDSMQVEPVQWTKWAWIIERKFDDWNIRIKQDTTLANKDGETFKAAVIQIITPHDPSHTGANPVPSGVQAVCSVEVPHGPDNQ